MNCDTTENERFLTRFHFNFTLLSSNCARRIMTVSLGQTCGWRSISAALRRHVSRHFQMLRLTLSRLNIWLSTSGVPRSPTRSVLLTLNRTVLLKFPITATAEISRDPCLISRSLLITLPWLKHPHLHTYLRRREHVLSTRIASPCFTRLRFQLRLSSRAPPDSTKRDRSTRSNWSRLASSTMYSTLQVLQFNHLSPTCSDYSRILRRDGMWVITVDVTSSVQIVSKCCVSMACGWCVAQTLLQTRVPTPPVLALCQHALQKVGSVRALLSKTVRSRPLRSASAGRRAQRVPLQCRCPSFS